MNIFRGTQTFYLRTGRSSQNSSMVVVDGGSNGGGGVIQQSSQQKPPKSRHQTTQVVSLGESITLAQIESEQRYGHYLARKKAMSLHSRIASLNQFYTPNMRIRKATPADGKRK